jgi:Cft2 family RNA processing exonuclease
VDVDRYHNHSHDHGDGDKREKEQEEEKESKGPFVCTAEEINEAFDHIKAVRYSQPIHLSGKSTAASLRLP